MSACPHKYHFPTDPLLFSNSHFEIESSSHDIGRNRALCISDGRSNTADIHWATICHLIFEFQMSLSSSYPHWTWVSVCIQLGCFADGEEMGSALPGREKVLLCRSELWRSLINHLTEVIISMLEERLSVSCKILYQHFHIAKASWLWTLHDRHKMKRSIFVEFLRLWTRIRRPKE
jgi:hypothetical protein